MKRIDVRELRRLYDSIQHQSVRWEGRQDYAVPWEDEELAAWRRGEGRPQSEANDDHLSHLRQQREQGHRTVRVRGLKRPATEYTRWEFEGYRDSVAAGQETVIVDLDAHPEFDGHDDFVVFDHDGVMWYRYDDEHRLLGYDYSDDPELVAERAALLDKMLAVAIPYHEVVL